MFTRAFRIGNEPQLRFTQGGDPVMGLSLAYSYGRKGNDGKKPTQWLDATLWGKMAEALQPYLVKGSQIVATIDDLHIEEYEGKNGPGHKLVGRVVSLQLEADYKIAFWSRLDATQRSAIKAYSALLHAKDMPGLVKAWGAVPKHSQDALTAFKDKRKAELTQPEQEAA